MLPLRGKLPALETWKAFQEQPASLTTLREWALAGLFLNVGIACGATSGNLIVLDLDTEAAHSAFATEFPRLMNTFTVITGSGHGYHIYLRPARLPLPCRALRTPIGNVELFATGQQVVAPPSRYPKTRKPYRVHRALEILGVPDLDDVIAWIMELPRSPTERRQRLVQGKPHQSTSYHNPVLFQAIAKHFRNLGYKQRGPWLNGPCIYPERHAHADARPSFGYNVESGYGFCFVCNSMTSNELADQIGLPTKK